MKMIKIKVENCLHCEYCIDKQILTGTASYYKDKNGKCHSYYLCMKNDTKSIPNVNKIPKWCPLENYEEKKNVL